MKLVTKREMEVIWQEAAAKGIVKRHAVASAGVKAARVIDDTFSSLGNQTALGLIGAGSKGLCAISTLIELRRLGWLTTAYLVDYPEVKSDPALAHYRRIDGEILRLADDPSLNVLRQAIADHPLLVDGVVDAFASPTADEVKAMRAASAEVREIGRYVVSLCMPSGVDAESGEMMESAFSADLTVIPGAAGIGLAHPQALRAAGQVVHVPLGVEELDAWQAVNRYLIDEKMVSTALSEVDFGGDARAFLLVGSVSSAGRSILAGEAALRLGLSDVTLGVPSSLHGALAGQFPEADWVLLPHDLGVVNEDAVEVLHESLRESGASACVLGVETGVEEATRRFWEHLLGTSRRGGGLGFVPTRGEGEEHAANLPPIVLGSDGMRVLAEAKDARSHLPQEAVLLASSDFAAEGELPLETALRLTKEWERVALFSGEITVVAHPDGRVGVIPYAKPRARFAGAEAVLGGAVVALLARSFPAWDAATVGAWLFSAAFNRAAQDFGWAMGVAAGDILSYLPSVVADFG